MEETSKEEIGVAIIKEVFGIWYLHECGISFLEAIEEVSNLGLGNWYVVPIFIAEELVDEDVEVLPSRFYIAEGKIRCQNPRLIKTSCGNCCFLELVDNGDNIIPICQYDANRINNLRKFGFDL